MKSNEALQADVQNAIKWQPLLYNAQIGVTATDGVISLNGIVDSYAKKLGAEKAAITVPGVKALVENIQVKFKGTFKKTNAQIALNVLKALKSNSFVPYNLLVVKVEDGCVTVEGKLPWKHQREAAICAVRNLKAVKGIINNIRITTESYDAMEHRDGEFAITGI
jgi:osmotically-inducible protein OsmY